MDNFKVGYKVTQLISILGENLSGKMNLARIKFFGAIYLRLIQSAKCLF